MGLLLRYRNAFNVNTFVFSLVMSLSYFHHYTSSLSLYKCSFNNLIAGLAIRFAFYKGFILVNNLKWYYETWRFFCLYFFFRMTVIFLKYFRFCLILHLHAFVHARHVTWGKSFCLLTSSQIFVLSIAKQQQKHMMIRLHLFIRICFL